MVRSKDSKPSRLVIDLVKSTSDVSSDDDEASNMLLKKATSRSNYEAHKSNVLDHYDSKSDQRRSKRERVSRIVKVDGYQVLVENNYTVTGVDYVFDKSLKRTSMDEVQANRKKTKRPRDHNDRTNKKLRHISKSELQRKEHNDAIRKKCEIHKANRLQYFAENADYCAPFLDEATVDHIMKSQRRSIPEVKGLKQPSNIQGELRSYQLAGLNWLATMHEKGMPMILGDEMGLGKTLQTISFISYLKESKQYSGPSLVICPLSVMTSWCSEIPKWAPNLKYIRVHASDPIIRETQMKYLANEPVKYDVVITTYDMIKASNTKTFWSRTYFNYVILDEGHLIKNHETEISSRVRSLRFESTLILTGTPLQNNLVELWAMLNYLYPEYFSEKSLPKFAKAFDLSHNIIQNDLLLKAHKLLSLFMLRRMKTEVEELIPKKIETTVYCPLSLIQRKWYKALLLRDIKHLVRDNETSPNNAAALRNLIMQLRKVCCHPYLFPNAEENPNETELNELVSASGKLTVLDMLLIGLFKKGHKVVLFSQFTMCLDVIEDYCNLRGWMYARLDGGVCRAERNYLINGFNSHDSPFFLFLVSTRAGGMGLNLQSADTCILYDSDWNPQADLQAMARVHRIGQKNNVHVYRLICRGTVEERILQRAEKKLYLDQVVNRGRKDDVDSSGTGLSSAELLETLKFGAHAVFGNSADEDNLLPDESDIAFLLDRNRSEEDSSGLLTSQLMNNAQGYDVAKELRGAQIFEGVDFKKVREKTKDLLKKAPKNLKNLADHFGELQVMNSKRAVTNRILMTKQEGSGYGRALVPVLSVNNYDLESGELSVFSRELKAKPYKAQIKRNVEQISLESHLDCQVCGEYGGKLISCTRCPVAVHPTCVGLNSIVDKEGNPIKLTCSHHQCVTCGKKRNSAGGILFPCHSCDKSFCDDCLPPENDGFRVLYTCPSRFVRKGFSHTRSGHIYIHCSHECEKYAKQYLNWKPPSYVRSDRSCPSPLDVNWAFRNIEKKEPSKTFSKDHSNYKMENNSKAKNVSLSKESYDQDIKECSLHSTDIEVIDLS